MPITSVNNVELYYEWHGKGDAVIVLNNGVIANTASWAYQLPALTSDFRILLYDMRGQGQSQKWSGDQPDYSWEIHADDLVALLDKLDVRSAHVGGISYGGELTLFFALRYPQYCKSLIVADAVSHVEPYLRAIIDSWILAAQTSDPETFYRSIWFWNFSEAFFTSHYDMLLGRIEAAESLHLPSVLQLCKCFQTLAITEKLPCLKQPTCVLVGEKDILKPVHYSKTIAQLIPNSELHILPEAGHASFWEKPEEFNNIMTNFLEKHHSGQHA